MPIASMKCVQMALRILSPGYTKDSVGQRILIPFPYVQPLAI